MFTRKILLSVHRASSRNRHASDKDAVGCTYAASSTIWFTLSAGVLNEV